MPLALKPHPTPSTRSAVRWLGCPLAASLLTAGALFYWRPWWVLDEAARTQLWLAGARSQYVQLGAYRIHFYAGGEGPPVVLLHGLGARSENWHGVATALIRHGRRVYALDLLGFGRSDRPDVDYSIALQTKILEQFLDSQKLERTDLGGWSMGGWVALAFSLLHPQRVRRLCVIDSAGLAFLPPFDPAHFVPTNLEQAQQLLRLLTPYAAFIPRFMVRALMRRLGAEAWVIRRALGTMIAGGDLLDGKLGAISAPTLIVWGKEDALIPLRCGLEMRREIPQSRLLIFDGCGHMLPIESSARLASETLRFLD